MRNVIKLSFINCVNISNIQELISDSSRLEVLYIDYTDVVEFDTFTHLKKLTYYNMNKNHLVYNYLQKLKNANVDLAITTYNN